MPKEPARVFLILELMKYRDKLEWLIKYVKSVGDI